MDNTTETSENFENLGPLCHTFEELGLSEYSDAALLGRLLRVGLHDAQFRALCADLIKQIFELSEEKNIKLDFSAISSSAPETSADLVRRALRSLEYVNVDNALVNFNSRLEMIEFLVSQLQMCRILVSLKMNPSEDEESDEDLLEMTEELYISNRPLRELTRDEKVRRMCQTLDLPVSKDVVQTLRAIEQRVKELLAKLPQDYVGKLLWQKHLTPQHIQTLEEINAALKEEYKGRQEVLLKRLDVTLQTFLWSEKAKENKSDMKATIESWRQRIMTRGAPNFTVFDVVAAQDDLLQIRKTSYKPPSLLSKTEETLKKIVIGDVPDRGGRVGKLIKIDPSMPKFQPRVVTNEEIGRGGPQRPQKPPNKKQRVQGVWTRAQEQQGRGSGSKCSWKKGPRDRR